MIPKSCDGCGQDIPDDLVIQFKDDEKEKGGWAYIGENLRFLCPLCYLMRKLRG
ncbi:hypothetical protein [Polycladomyces subterraneus]|uniref:Uncharacterized protein n=1 Tax=Polycladomyces subterraneus TaxID=1016997 RepID=A0ABT8IQ76_9BACL|nr:hypothetical protein [Polycladomyces subterraneus]MDN4594937.1 hypothetical protein [Polycladomyces subterraneus]